MFNIDRNGPAHMATVPDSVLPMSCWTGIRVPQPEVTA